MEGRRFEDIVRILIYVQLFLTSVCVGSSPCMPESDRFGRYTVIGGSGNTSSTGVPSGSRVQVSVTCDVGAIAQSLTTQCSNGTWIPSWPRCEDPCSVPRNRGQVRQFVNGDATRPITSYYTHLTVPDGTQLVARCRDPGKYRLIGKKRRTCEGGRWTGEEPECQPVETQVLFYGAPRDVASDGTVVVYVHRGNPNYLDVICFITSLWLRPPRLTTPLVNDGDLWNWPRLYTDTKRLNPISTDFSGMYTCNGSSSFHSVHVLFKAAECKVPAAPEHGRLLDGSRQQAQDIFPAGTSVSFECEDDYSLVGSRRITCETEGQWSNDSPVCRESTEPPQRNGSCSISCCTSSEYSCNPGGCYCDSWCERTYNCCDDYEDVCPSIGGNIDVFISNTTYNMRGSESLLLLSPNYPNNYNNLENILWHVRAVHGRRFLMNFGTVRLHSIRDYVRIYTGISDVFEESTQIFHLTYNPSGGLLQFYWSVHPNMWLQFSTDAFGTDQGLFIVIASAYGDCDGFLFQCTNGQCIYSSAVCDGLSDCVDSSDEYCTAECEALAAPEHGRLLDGSRQQARDIFPDGATVSFECEDDYSLVGSWEITCEKGQWSDDPPVCRVSRCPVLNIPDHVVIEGVHFSDERNIGDERIFNCVEGYVLQGDTNNLRCLESGVWSDPLPTCEESTEPPQRSGSCSNSCCTSSEYSCNPGGCYCDTWCERNDNCCDDYEDVCPILDRSIDVIISNTTYNMRGFELLDVFSPNFPNNYNNLENILWHVRNVHGRRFLIDFGAVRLHSIHDYVRIYTGISDVFEESTQIFHLTYNSTDDLPDNYWSVHSNMWLRFSTNEFGTDYGFMIVILSYLNGDCDGIEFQCTNGQCIRSSAVCDGLSDCVDSSDEYCTAECKVPMTPEHGRLLDGARQEPRDIFPAGATVSFECEDDYSLVGSREITCETEGQWSDDPPVCRG